MTRSIIKGCAGCGSRCLALECDICVRQVKLCEVCLVRGRKLEDYKKEVEDDFNK